MIDLDLSALPPPARKALDPAAPPALRGMAAKGVLPGVKPGDVAVVLVALATGDDARLAETASATLAQLPPPVLAGALGADLPGPVIHHLAGVYAGRDEVLEKLLAMPRVAADTVADLAGKGSERLTEIIATNEQRLLAHPVIIERLYMNGQTRMSTADRLIDLAARQGLELTGIPAFREAVEALKDELIPEPSEEPTYDDILFRETAALGAALEREVAAEGAPIVTVNDEGEAEVNKKVLPLHAQLAEMTIGHRIRKAQLGTGAERALLLHDKNKLVAAAAIRSPMIQEADIERISKDRTVHDEVLRIIGNTGKWLESHIVKYNLVSNPRTPFYFSARLIPHLRDDELKRLEKSKEVAASVRNAAKQHLSRKSKKR